MKKYILKLFIFLLVTYFSLPIYSSGNSYLIKGNKCYEEYCTTEQNVYESYEKFKERRKKIFKRAEEYYLKSSKISPRETIPKLLKLYGNEFDDYKGEFLKYVDVLVKLDDGNKFENCIEAIEWCLSYQDRDRPSVSIYVDCIISNSQLHDKELQNELLKKVDVVGVKNFNSKRNPQAKPVVRRSVLHG